MNRVLNAFNRASVALLLVLVMLPVAAAQSENGVLDEATFDVLLADFLALEAGFEAVDVDDLEFRLLSALPDTGSVFSPSGALDPFTKAVMASELVEGRLERSRYQLTLRLVNVEYSGVPAPGQFVFVTAERFNLGPVIHAELVEELGADVVAPLEEFGVGPNTSWRFVMQPLQGHLAMLVGASRKVMEDGGAGEGSCLYGPCLGLGWEGGPQAWDNVESPPFEELAPAFELATADWELLNPEEMVAVVSAAAGFDAYMSEVSGPERQLAQIVIEQNLGQGSTIAAVLRQGDLLDDSLAAIWHRAVDVGFAEGRSVGVAYECRRGDEEFATPGTYCP